MKDTCCDIVPILGSSDGYREKQSNNGMMHVHLAWKHIAPN